MSALVNRARGQDSHASLVGHKHCHSWRHVRFFAPKMLESNPHPQGHSRRLRIPCAVAFYSFKWQMLVAFLSMFVLVDSSSNQPGIDWNRCNASFLLSKQCPGDQAAETSIELHLGRDI